MNGFYPVFFFFFSQPLVMSDLTRLSIMDQVHLAGEDEDELYSGYNEFNPIFDTQVKKIIQC